MGSNDLDEYEQQVQPANQVFHRLYQTMLADLDTERGGFGWWHGYLDWKRICLLSEYLIASVAGVSTSLLDAALQVQSFKQLQFADDMWLRAQWRAVEQMPGATTDDFLAAQERGKKERRRDRERRLAAEHCFYHLAQTFDRLAACIIGIAGIKTSILRADWRHVEQAIDTMEKGNESRLEPTGTDGRLAQDRLLRCVSEAIELGPTDWVPWVLSTRDSEAHRAPRIRWHLGIEERRRTTGLVVPFHLQPGWAELEAMLRRSDGRVGSDGPTTLLLMRHPTDVLAILVRQMVQLSTEVGDALTDLWQARRQERTLIVQPGQQWKRLADAPVLSFDPEGAPVPFRRDTYVHVAPDLGIRMRAAKVFDDHAHRWCEED